MSAKVNSIGLKGLEGYRVQVEVEVMEGVESVIIVGLPDASVKESRERVSAALHNMGHSIVDKKIVVNLSPAEQKKNGPLFDLAIALGVLIGGEFVSEKPPKDAAFIGALSLDGSIVPVQGMLPCVLAAKQLGMKKLYLPFEPYFPQIAIEDLELVYVSSVHEVLEHLSGKPVLPFHSVEKVSESKAIVLDRDFKQIIGHECAKRALEIAAAGGHHVMMEGPPGCGKSMLAETFPTILPQLSKDAQLEKVSLYQLADAPLDSLTLPPFRHPHHSASAVSIIGGGSNPKPGEVSLAHCGVQFLDELAEFSKKTLDMLRQPLQNGKVTISRAHSTVTYPSTFIFLAAMNPCPCGYLGSSKQYCTCTENKIRAYQNRVSGPILDRMDIVLTLKPVNLKEMNFSSTESSLDIRKRIVAARQRQYERYGAEITNGEVLLERLLEVSPLTEKQKQLMHDICMEHGLSNRVHVKVTRIARTIADLNNEEKISDQAMIEAFELRGIKVKGYQLGEYHG
ncbi:magnesium chelatase [Anaerobacillus alkalilacustris]|uniref:Magnesium chelatase n=1 Tax=Anaerobacillus alkalilacustris TaxID=393763 RepID=A0A1S2LP19_9BACI|nr:YifB family Mg chelatase-like AAA ATPase [Anaerobacillus alkalilacustris]OIJ14269.1 magnesium chelatase [Anaerobacillus alkalilacustris]